MFCLDSEGKKKFSYFVQGNGPDGFYAKGVFGTNGSNKLYNKGAK